MEGGGYRANPRLDAPSTKSGWTGTPNQSSFRAVLLVPSPELAATSIILTPPLLSHPTLGRAPHPPTRQLDTYAPASN